MSFTSWLARCSGGFSIIAVLALSIIVIRRAEISGHVLDHAHVSGSGWSYKSGILTVIFAYYCLALHSMGLVFTTRSCWGIYDMISELRRLARQKLLRNFKPAYPRPGSPASLFSADTLTSAQAYSSSSSDAGGFDVEKLADDDSALDRVIHAVMIPNYKEELDSLRETLEVLACHPRARNCYDIYLGMEQREANSDLKAMRLMQGFESQFRTISFTTHPSDLPGETPGKGSNIAWVARELSRNYPAPMRKDVVVTGIDADSHLLASHFSTIASMHLSHPETAGTTMYCAPIIFDRNAHTVPAIVRVGDIMWSAGGISGLYRGSAIAPPTSVYSLPLELVDRVGGWDTGAEAIGEDLHMYLKCFFALNGHLTTRTVFSPVSQSNVTDGTRKGFTGTYLDVLARYKQALRHMWGALDFGYALKQFARVWRERKHTSRAFRPLHASFGDNSELDASMDLRNPDSKLEGGIYSDVVHESLSRPDWTIFTMLFHRLFEAHFLPLQLTTLVFASTIFSWLIEGAEDPYHLAWIFPVCALLRVLGLVMVVIYLYFYETYHELCVATREREMVEASIADGMCFSRRNFKSNVIDYTMFPFVGVLFGALPTLHAQMSHFWTNDLVYTVSKKVLRQRAKSFSAEPPKA